MTRALLMMRIKQPNSCEAPLISHTTKYLIYEACMKKPETTYSYLSLFRESKQEKTKLTFSSYIHRQHREKMKQKNIRNRRIEDNKRQGSFSGKINCSLFVCPELG